MIFLTVGTQFPFDRLVKAVDSACQIGLIEEKIIAQIGNSDYKPASFEAVESLSKEEFEKYCSEASAIISHAGMGTIITAMEKQKPLLVMPRLAKYKEVVHDHQLHIAKRFETDGCMLVAYSEEEIPVKLKELKAFVPEERQNQTQKVTERISQFLKSL